jgi:hypothetical protein
MLGVTGRHLLPQLVVAAVALAWSARRRPAVTPAA